MQNPILDDIAKLMTDAAGVAHGMRKEAEVAMTSLLERWLAEQNIATREEVDALRESVRVGAEERETLAARIAALEAALAERQSAAAEAPTEPAAPAGPPPESESAREEPEAESRKPD